MPPIQTQQPVQASTPPRTKGPGEKYKNVERPLGRILIYNFLGGITWSLGVLVGVTIVFSILAYFISQLDFIPNIRDILINELKSFQNEISSK